MVTLPAALRLTKPPDPRAPLALTLIDWVVVMLPEDEEMSTAQDEQSPLPASSGAFTATLPSPTTVISPPEAPPSPLLPPVADTPSPDSVTAPVPDSMSMKPP